MPDAALDDATAAVLTGPGGRRPHPLSVDAHGRIDLKCLPLPRLERWFVEVLGDSADRAGRVFRQVWREGVRSFDDLDRVARGTVEALKERAYLSFLEPVVVLASDDGTRKFLWKCEDGRSIESVLIPDGDRLTLCMSSQVGCAMACTFCLTGDLGLIRHLKASEIANQPLQVGRQLPEGARITNLVLMGMGEPLHNLPNLIPALETCLDDRALNFSHRKVTVSTVGLVEKMPELAAALPVNLAVSLNATTLAQRSSIMPITRKHDLDALLDACRRFPLPAGKRIQFEYVMFAGFNDTLDDADRLAHLLRDIPSKVNLIPYNDNPDRDLHRPSDEAVLAFLYRLRERGVSTSIRTSRGTDISAACGQLGKAWEQAQDRGWLHEARRVAGLA